MSGEMRIRGRTALITGAGGGIGRAIALSLARRGATLALSDIDHDAAARTAGEAEQLGVRATAHLLDVSDAEAVASFPAEFGRAHAGLDILVNNAGVALGGTFEQVTNAEFEWLFGINFWGVVRMTRAFLPLLRAADEARIVNMSSVFGIVSPPGQTAYSASKFAVRGFSNALAHELVRTKVGVTVAHPGGVATSIARNARIAASLSEEERAKRRVQFERFLRLSPERAAETIVRAVEKRRRRVVVGGDAKAAALLERLAPVAHGRLFGKGK